MARGAHTALDLDSTAVADNAAPRIRGLAIPTENRVLPRENAVRHHVPRVSSGRAFRKLLRIEVQRAQGRDVAVEAECVPEIAAVGQQRPRLADRRHLVAFGVDD